jgi:hypothetical protein
MVGADWNARGKAGPGLELPGGDIIGDGELKFSRKDSMCGETGACPGSNAAGISATGNAGGVGAGEDEEIAAVNAGL